MYRETTPLSVRRDDGLMHRLRYYSVRRVMSRYDGSRSGGTPCSDPRGRQRSTAGAETAATDAEEGGHGRRHDEELQVDEEPR